MNKVYFRVRGDGEKVIHSWNTKTLYVDEESIYSEEEVKRMIAIGMWIPCEAPIKTKNSIKRPNENWKKTINKHKFYRCIKECVDLGAGMYYNPATNCFYGTDWCVDDSEAYFKCNLSKAPESVRKFKEDVLTIYNEYLEEEMKQYALQKRPIQ